jgi:uncharacterized protein YfaS (alpha-2-macroglobulin family)
VVVTDLRGEVVASGRSDASGAFSFAEVTAGAYTLAVSAEAHRPTAVPIEVAGSGETVQDVELLPGARLAGTVRAKGGGGPVADARVTLLDAAGNVVAVQTTGADGQYAVTDLTGGQYTVTATGYPPVATSVGLGAEGTDGHDLWLGHPAG